MPLTIFITAYSSEEPSLVPYEGSVIIPILTTQLVSRGGEMHHETFRNVNVVFFS